MTPPPTKNPLGLNKVTMRNNWKLEKVRQPQWLVYGMGGKLDQVALAFIEYLRAERSPNMRLAYAGEKDLIPGSTRTIRVILVLHQHHRVACDVHLYAQGPDLYVRFEIVARTLVGWLRWILLGIAFGLVFVGLYWAILCRTGLIPALATEYAQKFTANPMQRQMMINRILHVEHWTLIRFANEDPKMFIERVAGIPTMIAGAIGFVLFRIPKDLLRYPCRWLGWPTPEKLRSEAISHSGRMQKTFSKVLYEVFDIDKGGTNEISE